MPVWSLEELHQYNQLLDGNLKLNEIDLNRKYDKFGGIPRFIFITPQDINDRDLNSAISSFTALNILSLIQTLEAVRENNYSHRVLEMIPSNANFRTYFHLNFLSPYIAKKVLDKLNNESSQNLLEFAITHANDNSGNTAVVRGKIYEILSHRRFNLH